MGWTKSAPHKILINQYSLLYIHLIWQAEGVYRCCDGYYLYIYSCPSLGQWYLSIQLDSFSAFLDFLLYSCETLGEAVSPWPVCGRGRQMMIWRTICPHSCQDFSRVDQVDEWLAQSNVMWIAASSLIPFSVAVLMCPASQTTHTLYLILWIVTVTCVGVTSFLLSRAVSSERKRGPTPRHWDQFSKASDQCPYLYSCSLAPCHHRHGVSQITYGQETMLIRWVDHHDIID